MANAFVPELGQGLFGGRVEEWEIPENVTALLRHVGEPVAEPAGMGPSFRCLRCLRPHHRTVPAVGAARHRGTSTRRDAPLRAGTSDTDVIRAAASDSGDPELDLRRRERMAAPTFPREIARTCQPLGNSGKPCMLAPPNLCLETPLARHCSGAIAMAGSRASRSRSSISDAVRGVMPVA